MIELADFVRELRRELETAVAAAPEDGLRFELGPIEIEVSVGVEKTANAAAKARFWVLELGGEGTVARSSVQTVKLTLKPHVGSSGLPPYVSGQEAERER
ncbi:trypco2 family protein [Micromonospora sp. C95]|uniref:trypco2 family protein n=1 Tax=Micromonospora sp. C95 TaxID=2824882 RepID=UPI001B376E34|nr:trypco2 family protein [Micromonospora sp. C95]MBQ1026507.1 hypothetical protein [Micromonospora sp. C95]